MMFGFEIILSTIAASGAYAILMSVLKKEPSKRWLMAEGMVVILTSFAALGPMFYDLMLSSDFSSKVPGVVMMGSLLVAIMFVIKLRLVTTPTVPTERVSVLRVRAIVLFALLILGWFSIVAQLVFFK